MNIERFSFGVGDRFSRQGEAQLKAVQLICADGVDVVPVWNKSHREHTTIGSEPGSVRVEADAAVKAAGWSSGYYVDADHIGLSTVDGFMDSSDFFTLDVADYIGQTPAEADVDAFVEKHTDLVGSLEVEGIDGGLAVSPDLLRASAQKFLLAVQEAGKTYRHIADKKGADAFVAEVSMDETDAAQTPVELLCILAAIGDEGIPIQTIAPKFTGRFNKGVDYEGDLDAFTREFNEDLAVIRYAVKAFGLPQNLKLSVHSGSDKFSIYPVIREAIKRFDAGLHIKTAGTTWLEELIGLAEAGGDGLALAQSIYADAFAQYDALAAPYATVIDIDPAQLPAPEEVNAWSSEQYTSALRHDQSCASYNPHLRQLLHIGYKIAAKRGDEYYNALERYADVIARNVTENFYERHLKPLFIG